MWTQVIIMIINDQDMRAFIVQEARRYFPELFEEWSQTAATPAQPAPVPQTGRLNPPVWNGFTDLPALQALSGDTVRRSLHPRDLAAIRSAFPILKEQVNGRPLIWLDNAATTQKPLCVIDRLRDFYLHENSNIHRGAHTLARAATESYEAARRRLAAFIGAPSPDTIIFVRGTTEAINLVAGAYGPTAVSPGDEILISQLEHHANIVPWQLLCRRTGAVLRSIPVDDSGQLDMAAYRSLLSRKTKIVAVAHVSNVLGTVAPVAEITALAHREGAAVLVDGAQAVSHLPVDVVQLDCDFYAFSGHKMFGPTGIGVLYGKASLLETMPPYQGGGNMIDAVTIEESRFKAPPHRFEAGTGNIADAVGLGQAAVFLSEIGMARIDRYERALVRYASESIRNLPGLTILGQADDKAGIVTFDADGHDNEAIAARLDRAGIAVRVGHHCAQPVLKRFGLVKAVRASLAVYNTPEEIDRFAGVLRQLLSRQSYFSSNSIPAPGK
jgi:cysteine desulfurase/selenocysteine lyase